MEGVKQKKLKRQTGFLVSGKYFFNWINVRGSSQI